MTIDLNQFTTIHHPLKRPLLVISGSRGSLSCGYLSVDSLQNNGDAAAIVKGVNNHTEMLAASIVAVTSQAESLGVNVGMKGSEALAIFQ